MASPLTDIIQAMHAEFTSLGRDELFDRLEEGLGAGMAVLTPNARLARALQADFDRRQLAAGRTSWEAPDIVAFEHFLRRCHEEARYSDRGADMAPLLSAPEEQILWEEAIRASPWRDKVMSVASMAALASEAWSAAHQWRIAGALDTWPGNEDSEAFTDWRRHYVRRTGREGVTDAARLPEAVAAGIEAFAIPATLVLYAFDLLRPQQRDLLAALGRAGSIVLQCAAPPSSAHPKRVAFDSPQEELECAARWARARLEEGRSRRIAVVVPALAQRRAAVARVFSRELPPSLFNLSLGAPLTAAPLAAAALALVECAGAPLAYERLSRIIRSPFIAGAQRELAQRARLDAALARLAPASVTLARLRALIAEAAARRAAPECPLLRGALDRLIEAARDSSRAPAHEWARRFTAFLDAVGFPGDRGLDSAEFQTLGKWREALATLATLGSVAPAWSASEARSRLHRLCADTLFQPASGDAPVQVLGILESAGLEFDHLWVSGLTEEAWPLAARPHALIPPALQKQAGIPQATPEKALEVDRAFTHAWRRSAGEVIFSSARADGDRELLPSPLIGDIAPSSPEELAIPHAPSRRERLFAAGRKAGAMVARIDNDAPALEGAGVQGGTAILVDQAACPFRAFAHFRLDARSLERPEPGLGPAERGQLLHSMMAKLWRGLRDQRTLASLEPAKLEALIVEAAGHAVARLRADFPGRLEGRFAELERARLAGLAREWLEIERSRPPFEVRFSEEPMVLAAGSLRLQGRVDRIDRIEGAGLAVIDYKSGQVAVSSWLGDRPDDVQLPLYALAADEPVDAVAFARLKTGQLGFAGIARQAGLLPGVKPVEEHRAAKQRAGSWPELLAEWRNQVDKLADGFASGNARVDPKRGLATCERCDLKPLCRVHERLGALDEGDLADAEAE